MSDNDNDDESGALHEEMAAELVEKLGVTPDAARDLMHHAEMMSLIASEVGEMSSEDAATIATRYILDTVRRARRGYRIGVKMFGPGGPPERDSDEEVREDAAAV